MMLEITINFFTKKKKKFTQNMEIKFKWSYLFYLECKMKFNIDRGSRNSQYQEYLLNKLQSTQNEHSQSRISKTIRA